MLKLETYVLEDETLDGWVGKAIHAVRLVCFLMILHIVYAFAVTVANRIKLCAYLVLFALAAWWGSLSHWLYKWDTFVWIAGVAAIKMNISEWRDEIEEGQEQEVAG